MQDLKKRLSNLLSVKSILTIALTAVFCYLAVIGTITAELFLPIFTMIVSFYFGTQKEKNDRE